MKKYKFYLALALILSSFTITKAETPKSNLSIKFNSPSEKESEIFDPIDLTKTDEIRDDIIKVNGLLRIDRTPDFHFGSPKIDEQLDYYYSLNGDKWSESLQISDYRYGYQDGWTLSARLTPFEPYFRDEKVNDIPSLHGTLQLLNTRATNLKTENFYNESSITLETNQESVTVVSAMEAFEHTIIDWYERDNEDKPYFLGQNSNVVLTLDGTNARVNVSYIAELSWILVGTTPDPEN